MPPCLLVKGFLQPGEVRELRRAIAARAELFLETRGRGGLGPRYAVIGGEHVRASLAEVEALGEQRVRPLLEEISGRRLQPLGSPRRAMRVQVYRARGHGFRWHFDGHDYAALVALQNDNAGETHVIGERLSRVLRPLLYPLYFLPQAFSLAPYERYTLQPGDLLFMRGGRVLHRGLTRAGQGERTLLVYAYDPVGKKRSALRDRVARLLNY